MTGRTNAGGMSVAQAMIKGTADANINVADVANGKIGYGANGQRVVGTAPKTMSGTFDGSAASRVMKWDSGFVPNFVMLTCTNKSGEFKTPAIVRQRSSSGSWSAIGSSSLWNYYDGSGGSSWGTITALSDTGCTFTQLQSGYNYAWIAWQ